MQRELMINLYPFFGLGGKKRGGGGGGGVGGGVGWGVGGLLWVVCVFGREKKKWGGVGGGGGGGWGGFWGGGVG